MEASDFPSEWAGTGLISLKRKRWDCKNTYHSMPFASASGLLDADFRGAAIWLIPIGKSEPISIVKGEPPDLSSILVSPSEALF